MPLDDAKRSFLTAARTATLATIADDGRPRLVPICFVLDGERLFTPIDEKPKRTADPWALARVRDIERRPAVTVLVDRWDEDWAHLAWLRCDGTAALSEDAGERAAAIAALRAKYPQYEAHDLEGRPLIRVEIRAVRSWGDLSGRGRSPSPSGGGSASSSSPGGTRRR
jgi:coenzyme F420-0:L-glutamate ligase / coenzyme F420-1:gamma-L-glutamate ligase